MNHNNGEPDPHSQEEFLQIEVNSIKFKIKYNLFLSKNFIEGVRKFTSRLLMNALKELSTWHKINSSVDHLPKSLLVINHLQKTMTDQQMKQAAISSQNGLLRVIDEVIMLEIFKRSLKLSDYGNMEEIKVD